MLEFKFHFTKTANLFHSISNLAEWHFSCRKNYNKIWLERTGALGDKEKQALERLAKLLIKYHFSSGQKGPNDLSKFLGIPFTIYSDDEVWEKVEEWVKPEEFLVLRNIFEIFGPRFEKLWVEEEPKLISWKTILVEELAKKKYDDLEKDLETFFDQKPKYSSIDVYFLMNPVNLGGGANIGPGRVTLECSALPTEAVSDVLNVLYHETTHLVFEYGYYQNLLERFLQSIKDGYSEKHAFFKSGRSLRVIINEAAISSLLPEGYLAGKCFGRRVLCNIEKALGKNFENIAKGKEDSFRAYRLFAAAKLFPVVKGYIKNKKPVDRAYLQKVWEVFEEFSEKVG